MRRLFLILTVLSSPCWSQPSAQQPAQPPILVKVEMPPAPRRDCLERLGPLIAAGVALIVGLTQLLLQRKSLKQNLFDRRFKVYSSVEAYLRLAIEKDGKTDVPAYSQFRVDTDPGEFLFGADVWRYIGEVGQLGLGFRQVQGRLEFCNNVLNGLVTIDPSKYVEIQEEQPNLLLEVRRFRGDVGDAFIGRTRSVFRDYLRLHHDARIDRWMESEVPAKFASKARD